MKIEITKEDIEKGKKGSCNKCPVARAIRRNFPRKKLSVSQDGIEIGKWTTPLPKRLDQWIGNFDNGQDVKPTSFELALL